MENMTKGDGWIFGEVDEELSPTFGAGITKYPVADKMVDHLVKCPINDNGMSKVLKLIFDEPKPDDYLDHIRERARRYAYTYYNCKKNGWRISGRRTHDNMGIMICRIKV